MTPTDYWQGSPYLTQAYLKAEELQFERDNYNRHQQGLYNHKGYAAVMADFGWNFGGRKGQKPEPYMEYPIAYTKSEKQAEKKRNIEKTLRWVSQGQEGD